MCEYKNNAIHPAVYRAHPPHDPQNPYQVPAYLVFLPATTPHHDDHHPVCGTYEHSSFFFRVELERIFLFFSDLSGPHLFFHEIKSLTARVPQQAGVQFKFSFLLTIARHFTRAFFYFQFFRYLLLLLHNNTAAGSRLLSAYHRHEDMWSIPGTSVLYHARSYSCWNIPPFVCGPQQTYAKNYLCICIEKVVLNSGRVVMMEPLFFSSCSLVYHIDRHFFTEQCVIM